MKQHNSPQIGDRVTATYDNGTFLTEQINGYVTNVDGDIVVIDDTSTHELTIDGEHGWQCEIHPEHRYYPSPSHFEIIRALHRSIDGSF